MHSSLELNNISPKPDDYMVSNDDAPVLSAQPIKRGYQFWMVIFSMNISLFLSALELTAVSTALPTIIHDLQGEDFVWVASAYALASTALLPTSGGIAQIFGRRLTLLNSILLFAVGSALCGSAQNMSWLIAARAIQGAGGGGILSLTGIVTSDLVPLQERGLFGGINGITWACAAAIGPVVGGSLAQQGQWRWIFYLNLPIGAVAFVLVLLFLRVPTPPGTTKEKLLQMDWFGSFLIITSTSGCIIALTWGGVKFPWSSFHVLVPLILGICGMAAFVVYEACYAEDPILPFSILTSRTSLSGYIQVFVNPIIMLAIIYYLPTYYQACRSVSPIKSGVYILGLAAILGPAVIISAVSVTVTKSYRLQLWTGWVFLMVGLGLMSTIQADTALSMVIGYPVLVGIGAGIIYGCNWYPVLAPLRVSQNAHAIAFFSFCRAFAAVWGVTIGTTVLQNELRKHLPLDVITVLPGGVEIVYSTIPIISSFPPLTQSEIRIAFAKSIAVIWQVMIGITAIGVISSVFMEALPLHTQVDERWALENS